MTQPVRTGELEDEPWFPALPLDELWEGEMVGITVEDADVLLVRLSGGEIHAYDDRCPHAGARLSDGELCAHTLRCRVHHWEFDVRTGDGINPRKCRLEKYPVQIVESVVLVRLRRPSQR